MGKITKAPKGWAECIYHDLLEYIQPTQFIVDSTDYKDNYSIPVLTAGKSFIKGYTDEKHGIFENYPAIIFDDFTTASRYVNFPFKVKSSAMKILIPSSDLVNLKFVYYLMQSTQIRSDTHKRYWISVYAKKQLLMPTFNEQERIVSKIEELLSEADKGVESLKTAKKQLEVYRQAVLKHVFEGKLTAQWREENKDKLESADHLVARIKKEREARYKERIEEWTAAIEDWEASGKKGKKPSRPRDFKSPSSLSADERREFKDIPTGWRWLKIGQLYDVFVGATPSRKNSAYWGGTVNWVSSGEVGFRRIRSTNEMITHAGLKNTSTQVHSPGTVMLGMIGEGKTRGQAAILEVAACHNQNTAAIRVSETNCSPDYLYHYFYYQYEETRKIGSGNNQKALNKERVSNIAIPVPPVKEQEEIARILDNKLLVIDRVGGDIDDQLSLCEVLRQSILKRAFSGHLVKQEPNDEPASVLLERIRAEKAALDKVKKSSKKKTSKTGKRRDAA